MSDKLVPVAAFSMPLEAQLARGRLEAEGIKVLVGGEGSVNVFSGIQGIGGKITLQVAEADVDRAAEILAPHVEDSGDAGAARSSYDDDLWLCPLCGDAVGDNLSVCPACETPRPAGRKSPAVTTSPGRRRDSQDIQEERPPVPDRITGDTPFEAMPTAVEDDLDLPDAETFLGDDLVRRAFLASLFGLFIPLIFLYSLWLLGRLALYPGKLGPNVMPRFYGAIALTAVTCLFHLVLFGVLLRR